VPYTIPLWDFVGGPYILHCPKSVLVVLLGLTALLCIVADGAVFGVKFPVRFVDETIASFKVSTSRARIFDASYNSDIFRAPRDRFQCGFVNRGVSVGQELNIVNWVAGRCNYLPSLRLEITDRTFLNPFLGFSLSEYLHFGNTSNVSRWRGAIIANLNGSHDESGVLRKSEVEPTEQIWSSCFLHFGKLSLRSASQPSHFDSLTPIKTQQAFVLLRPAANFGKSIVHNIHLPQKHPTGQYGDQNCGEGGFDQKAILKRYIAKACLFLTIAALCYVIGVKGLLLLSAGRNIRTILRDPAMIAVALFVSYHVLNFVGKPLLVPCNSYERLDSD